MLLTATTEREILLFGRVQHVHAGSCLPGGHVPRVPGIPAYILFQSAGLSLELLDSPPGDMMLAEEEKQHQCPRSAPRRLGKEKGRDFS